MLPQFKKKEFKIEIEPKVLNYILLKRDIWGLVRDIFIGW